jgi:hypothetical protein
MEGTRQGSGGGNEGVERDVASTGDEGRRAAEVTPPIGEDATPGQTSSPAPEGDVGVPSDEKIAEEEEAARREG